MTKWLFSQVFLCSLRGLVAMLLGNAVAALAQEQFALSDGSTSVIAATTIFSDNFDAASLNTNKWRIGTNAGNKSAVANAALELRSQAGFNGAESGWIITRKAFAARNTIVKVKVVKPNDDGALGLCPTYNLAAKTGIADQENWYRFYLYRSSHTGAYRLFVQWKKGGVENGIDVTGNRLITGAIFLRLRFDHVNIHFEASFNGTSWTDTYVEPFALPGYTLDSLFYYELTGYNTAANGILTVDNFSIISGLNAPDTKPPLLSQIAAQNLATTSAEIKWQTDEPADSQVEYGLAAYGTLSPLDLTRTTSHLVKLAPLQPNQTYHYRIRSKDAAGNLALSGDYIFTTLPEPGVTMKVPNGGEWWLAGETRAITWKATTTIANIKIEHSPDGGATWHTIIASTANDGLYNWLIPDSVSANNLIRLSNAANASVADASNTPFFITRRAFVEFAPKQNSPVLTPGPPGNWDERITERGWFMYENGMYHAWYGGWKGAYDHAIKNFVKLGYAYSTDGVHWTKYAGNPIVTQNWCEDMVVVKSGNTYYMFAENEYYGDGDGASIDLYTSTDKINWTRHGMVLSPHGDGWEATAVGTPTVWKEANTWYMLYEGFGSGIAGQVGLATSLDGRSWTRHPQNPVLTNALGNQLDIALDSVIKISGVYHAYGHYDNGQGAWAGGMFTSTNLAKWTAYPGNPIIDNSAVIVDNGVNYLMYGITSNLDALAPYYLKFSTYTKDVLPPVISGVTANVINGVSVQINWKTNEEASAQVEYGLIASYGAQSPLDSTLLTSHSARLIGLQPNKTYHYRVKSCDAAGNLAMSGDFTFKTPNWILVDKFNNGSLNLTKWQLGANAANQSAVVDSVLQLQSLPTLNGVNESGWVITKNAYAARNTQVQIKVVRPNNDGALGISPTYNLAAKTGVSEQKNWYRFYNFRNGSSGPYRLIVQTKKNGVETEHEVTGNLVLNGGFYLRLRFDNTNIHFEASVDGVAWVDTYNETFALPGYTLDSPFYYELAAYNTAVSGVWRIDDFSILPAIAAMTKSENNEIIASPLPLRFALHSYPNPFAPQTRGEAARIQLALPQAVEMQLSIFDLTGREVRVLMLGTHTAGNYEMRWNGKDRHGLALGSGIYLLRLRYRGEGQNAWSQMVRRVTMVK